MRLYLLSMVGMAACMAACVCMAGLPQPEPEARSLRPIGVMGDNAVTFLKAQGFDCEDLPENSWLDISVLTNYPVVVCDSLSHRSNPVYYEGIRAYVKAGGIVFLTYCLKTDIGGSYVSESSAWGPCLRYTVQANAIAGGMVSAGDSVALTNAWSDRLFSSYGLCEPHNSHASVLIYGDFNSRGRKTDSGDPGQVVTNIPWLIQNPLSDGVVLYGMTGAFGHAVRCRDIILSATLSNVVRYAAGLGKDQPDGGISTPKYQPRVWTNLDRHSLRRPGDMRTAAFVSHRLFFNMDANWLAERLSLFDASRLDVIVRANDPRLDDAANKKIQELRDRGVTFSLSFSPGNLPLKDRMPGTPARAAFFKSVADWAPRVDVIGMDEWYFTPSRGLATQGAHEQSANVASFRQQFQEFSGFNDLDIDWAFNNIRADDERAHKLWAFSGKIADDFMLEFVKTAKQSNPDVRTWISYITHNWNKTVTCLDRAVGEFDELLNCQTYWYGSGDDPLNTSGILAPVGLGKIISREYPNSFSWTGFSTLYAGGKMSRNIQRSYWKPSPIRHYGPFYNNTPEEVVPYLALLYASSDGVFLFTVGEGDTEGDGSDVEFSDVVRLVSHLVPRIRDYKKSEIGYYYNPGESWEISRQRKSEFYRRDHERVLGILQMFCDVELTENPQTHRNLIIAGPVWKPIKPKDYRAIYRWGGPWFQHDAQPVSPTEWNILGAGPARAQLSDALNNTYGKYGKEICAFSRYHIRSVYPDEAGSIIIQTKDSTLLQSHGDAHEERSLKAVDDSAVTVRSSDGKTLVNTINPRYLSQSTARRLIGNDLESLGWKIRDCPQISSSSNLVAVTFRDARDAVIDFGDENKFTHVSVLMFNGKIGIERAETMPYKPGMEITLPPYSVLIAQGIK